MASVVSDLPGAGGIGSGSGVPIADTGLSLDEGMPCTT